jgi:hypothetical protein
MGWRISGLLITGGAIAAAVTTAVTGTPASLPDIALGAPVLFHLERLLALLAAYVAVILVVSRAWGGELPTAISTQGVIYSAEETKAATIESVKELRAELERLRDRLEVSEDAE